MVRLRSGSVLRNQIVISRSSGEIGFRERVRVGTLAKNGRDSAAAAGRQFRIERSPNRERSVRLNSVCKW
jgi:hypothetical protein